MKNLSLYTIIVIMALWVATSCKKADDLSAEIDAIENNLLPAIQAEGDSVYYNIGKRMEHYQVPGVSLAVIKDGELRWAKGYGVANTETGAKVDTNTLFQAASISKPIAALAVLKLLDKGLLKLDENVNAYLKDWQIPENGFTQKEKVTLRRLLTHTAGTTVHGFPGYTFQDSLPDTRMVLEGKGNTDKIIVDTVPGIVWRYSGGGYTIVQEIVEEVSSLPFEKYLHDEVLQALGMMHSTFEQPISKSKQQVVSLAYDSKGAVIAGGYHNYPEKAAAGLWTTPSDLARYCIFVQRSVAGKTSGEVLAKETIDQMLTKDKNNWGLGPVLSGEKDSLMFMHGGKNAGFTNMFFAFANRGDGLIIMTSGDNGGGLISEIQRAVSTYYNWDTHKSKLVKVVQLPIEKLNSYTGKYSLDGKTIGEDNYHATVSLQKGKLQLFIKEADKTLDLLPIAEDKFVDREEGNEVVFDHMKEKKAYQLIWNGDYKFVRYE
ncbi:beta-lactamase family protein [Olivibacter sp. SDN3]|uniref:serine hydrolase domain-containing protein n=1 Tax=Olivibacter sp. SDN3 TaxID=2764720 RepID=UPI0016514F1C|nr:serine hydrolase domain-containing protein [Olivibacter sp. SDN3]QNL48245.1 beta-lactamase family protein [Olivibacter sp. SDN3]